MLKGCSGAAPPPAAAPVRGQLKTVPEPEEDKFSKAEAPAFEEKGGKKGGKGSGRSGKDAAGHTYDYFRDKWDKFDVVSRTSLKDLREPGWVTNISRPSIITHALLSHLCLVDSAHRRPR